MQIPNYQISEIDYVVFGERVQEIDHVVLHQAPLLRRHLVGHDVQAFVHLPDKNRIVNIWIRSTHNKVEYVSGNLNQNPNYIWQH